MAKYSEVTPERAAEMRLYHKQYVQAHKERIKIRHAAYVAANKERIAKRKREWQEKNRERLKAKAAAYYAKHKERLNARHKAYAQKHKDRLRKLAHARHRARYYSDPAYRLRTRLRCMVNRLIAYGYEGEASTMELLGCSWQHARDHLASQFKDGMSWDNYGRGGWHIDHIRPLRSFDLSDPAQAKAAFNYTNLQPLWQADNIRKGAKWAA